MSRSKKKPDHLVEHLMSLQGGTILGVAVTTDDVGAHDRIAALIVEKDGKKMNCWILRDPEGNGPGWLDIEEE